MSFALKSNAPCKGCDDRHHRCHVDCPEYRDWSDYHKQIKANAIKTMNANIDILDYQIKNVQRSKKNHSR